MPNLSQAKKALRKSKKRASRNKITRLDIKNFVKKTKKIVVAQKKDEAATLLKQTIKKLDKAAQKGIIHKNTAARRKSRLTKKVNAIAKST